eukprot:6186365-Pleurochrysis_carterae.AAC.1
MFLGEVSAKSWIVAETIELLEEATSEVLPRFTGTDSRLTTFLLNLPPITTATSTLKGARTKIPCTSAQPTRA